MSSNDGPKPKDVARRDFLGIAASASGVAFAVAAGSSLRRFVEPPSQPFTGTAVVGKLEDFPVGTAKTVLINERPVLVVRGASGEIRAFYALCTHLQCVVAYVPERNRIECPCHQGVYSTDGQNIAGPPPRPLDELAVTIDDRTVIVSTVA
jgi:cytochrome b6-f complex iron-sulfur subunit